MYWSRNLSYAVGLIATDGSLSKDGRHIELTSKDIEQIENFLVSLNLRNKIGVKKSSYNPKREYYRTQFSNVKLYKFLLKIGLEPNKTKTIKELEIPNRYFADFLRGHLDGDGYTTSFWDTKFKNSFRLYTGFVSASEPHLRWMRGEIEKFYSINGSIRYDSRAHIYQLKYAKKASVKLLNLIYYRDNLICLKRKYSKICSSLGIISKQAQVVE